MRVSGVAWQLLCRTQGLEWEYTIAVVDGWMITVSERRGDPTQTPIVERVACSSDEAAFHAAWVETVRVENLGYELELEPRRFDVNPERAITYQRMTKSILRYGVTL